MLTLTVNVSGAEEKALRYSMADPQEWFANFVNYRIRVAMQEIYDAEIEKIKSNPKATTIPINVKQVVTDANIKSAAERNLELEEMMKNEKIV